MEVVHGEALFDGGVDEGDVGVAAGGEGAFAGVEAHQAGAVGGGDIHEAGEGHTAFGDAFAVGDADAGFGAVVSAGDIAHGFAGDFEVPVGAVFVGGHSVEAAPGDALPQHSGVLGGFEGRVGVVLHPVFLFVVVGVEAGVVVQGFAVGGDAPAAGFADGVDALAGADMDEIDRGARPFGHPEDAAEGDILGFVAVDEGHIPPLVAFLALQLFVHILHHVVVLGVDEEHRVVALDDCHQVVEVSHADFAGFAGHFGRADVGGEYFDAGPAVLDVLVEGFEGALGDFAEEHQVVGVVGVGVAAPGAGSFLDGVGDGVAGVMDGEVQQGGGAAEEGGAADLLRRRGAEVAGAHNGGVNVGVGFDAAGDDHLAGGVDDAGDIVGHGVGGGDGDDFFALDADIPVADAPGGDDLAAADNQVQHSMRASGWVG